MGEDPFAREADSGGKQARTSAPMAGLVGDGQYRNAARALAEKLRKDKTHTSYGTPATSHFFGAPEEEETPLLFTSLSFNTPHEAEKRHLPHRHRMRKQKLAVFFAVFALLLPGLFLAAIAFPDHGPRTFFKQHLDRLLFYSYLYIIAMVGIASLFSDSLRRYLLQRPKLLRVHFPSLLPYAFSNAELFLSTLFVAMLSLVLVNFLHVKDFEVDRALLPGEKVSLILGELSNLLLGLLILPASRNSIWCVSFGVDFHTIIRFHVILGNMYLVNVLAFAVSWVFVGRHKGAGLIFPFQNYSASIYCFALVMAVVTYSLLSREAVRRRAWELFSRAHRISHVSLLCSTLVFAKGAWPFLAGGALLCKCGE
jgi:hypothetical protein